MPIKPADWLRRSTAGMSLPFLLTAWTVAVGTGFWWLESQAATPAVPVDFAGQWPDGSRLTRASDQMTLLVFLHPHCPCSRASLEGLARLLVEAPDVTVKIVGLTSEPSGPDWHLTDLWRTASRMPGVELVADPDGVEAARFRADVSGRALLYSPEGRLLFEGGLTPARGHAGDSLGARSLADWIRTGHAAASEGPAFGCELFAPAAGKGLPCKTR